MVEENSNMLLGTGEKPDAIRWILLAIQHVCAMLLIILTIGFYYRDDIKEMNSKR